MAAQLSYENVTEGLLQSAPELRPLLDEHIQQYDELLPHVFFGDVTRFVMDRVRTEGGAGNQDAVVRRILGFLEEAMASSDENVQELVSLSFLENLDPSDPAYEELKAMLGPNLRRELENYRK
ncbi:MAG TPA: hypothetical protein VGY31_11730 [Terriglobia bacterium]|nr:hypothetical protein [Terriglobia bacterium]